MRYTQVRALEDVKRGDVTLTKGKTYRALDAGVRWDGAQHVHTFEVLPTSNSKRVISLDAGEEIAIVPRIHVEHVRINSQGYTASGEYRGVGLPLYRWSDEYDLIGPREVRAHDREDAQEEIRKYLKNRGVEVFKFARSA